MNKISLLLLFAASSLTGNVWAQKIHVSASDQKVLAKTSIAYHATCPESSYVLQIGREERRVTLTVTRKETREYDLSSTGFGSTFLQRPLYGNFGMTCGPANLNVYFRGVEVLGSGQPRPVAFNVTLFDDGRVDDATGLETRSLDFINQLAK
jgi:hypothetical protein